MNNELYEIFRLIGIIIGSMTIFIILIAIVMYIFESIGMYSISRRRRLGTSGFAWVPILRMFKLGQLADDAIYHKKWTKTHYMVFYPVFYIAGCVCLIVSSFISAVSVHIGGLDSIFSGGFDLNQLPRLLTSIRISVNSESGMIISMIIGGIGYLLIIAATVFYYICLFNIYQSCSTSYVALFILGLVFFFLNPFFIFAIRHKDHSAYYHYDKTADDKEPTIQDPAV